MTWILFLALLLPNYVILGFLFNSYKNGCAAFTGPDGKDQGTKPGEHLQMCKVLEIPM